MLARNEPKRLERRRARWRQWYHRDNAGIATTRVRYNGVTLAKLIVSGWLLAHREIYTDAEISAAIANLFEHGDLPPKGGMWRDRLVDIARGWQLARQQFAALVDERDHFGSNST